MRPPACVVRPVAHGTTGVGRGVRMTSRLQLLLSWRRSFPSRHLGALLGHSVGCGELRVKCCASGHGPLLFCGAGPSQAPRLLAHNKLHASTAACLGA